MSYFLTNNTLKTTLFYCGVVLLSTFFASVAEQSKNLITFRLNMLLSFTTLFFVYAYRNFSAIDDPSYIRIFHNISTHGAIEYFKFSTMEPGYIILNSIVSFFTDDYLYMQLLTSFIPLFLFYYGFEKYKHLISLPTAVFLLSTMIYFQMLAVALVRMFIALAIFFVALRYIPEQKPKKYIASILLATSFHYSAFFMIFLVYFAINKKNLSKKVVRMYSSLFIASPFVFIMISRIIVPLLGNRYSSYGSVQAINIGFDALTTLPLIILLLFFFKGFKETEKLYFKLFVFVYAISLIISLFGGMVSLGRLVFYCYTAFIAAAAMVHKANRFNSTKIIFASIIIFYGFLYLFYSQFINEQHIQNLFPYQNIFFTI